MKVIRGLLTLPFAVCLVSASVAVPAARQKPIAPNTKTQAPKEPAQRARTMFGVRLASASTDLAAEVERLYGKSLSEIRSSGPGSILADSRVYNDGTPIVTTYTTPNVAEDTIVHELHHLKLIAQGFPEIIQVITPLFPDSVNALLADFIHELNEGLHDGIFFPRMRRDGYTPEGAHPRIDDASQANDLQYPINLIEEWMKQQFRAVAYFTFARALDVATLARVENWYELKGWAQELAVGKQMARAASVLTERRTFDACEVAAVVQACFAVLDRFNNGSVAWRYSVVAKFSQRRGMIRFNLLVASILPPHSDREKVAGCR
jgi:hypothetical protein